MSDADIKAIADEMVRRYPENLSSISIEGRGFMLGATWGLEHARANDDPGPEWVASNILEGAAKRIKELEAWQNEATKKLIEAGAALGHLSNSHDYQMSKASERIEELESKLKLADRNNELLRGHRDQLEAKIKPEDDIIPEDYYIK